MLLPLNLPRETTGKLWFAIWKRCVTLAFLLMMEGSKEKTTWLWFFKSEKDCYTVSVVSCIFTAL